MGASFVTLRLKGTRAEVKNQFEAEQAQDRYENGHSYSGGIGMATGLEFARPNVVFTEQEAYAWLDEHCEKWEAALAVRLTDGEYMIGALCSS